MARTLTLTSEEVRNESSMQIDAVTTSEDTLQVPSNEEVNLGSTISFESCEEAFNEICRRFLLTETEVRESRAFSAHGPPLGEDWVMSDDSVEDLVHWTEQPLVFLQFEMGAYEDSNSTIWSLHRGAILDFHQGKIMISEIREREEEDDEPGKAALNDLGEDFVPQKQPDIDPEETFDQECRDALNDRFDSAVEELSMDEHGNVDIERTLNRYWAEQRSLHPVERDGDLIERFLDAQEKPWEEYNPNEAELDAEDEATLAQLSPSELEALMNEQEELDVQEETTEEAMPVPPRKYPLPADDYLNANEIAMLPGYEFNVDPEIERKADLDVLHDMYRLNQLPAANISQSISQAVRALNAVELSKPVLDKQRQPESAAAVKLEQLHRDATLPMGGTSPFATPGPMEFVDDTNYRSLTGFSRMDMNHIDEVDDFPRNLTRIIDVPSDLLLALKTVPWPKLRAEERENFSRFFTIPLTFQDSPLNHNDATYAIEEELQRLEEETPEELDEDFEGDFDDK